MGFNDYYLNQLQIQHEVAQIQAMRAAGVLRSRQAVRNAQSRVQALTEAGRSILTTAVTEFLSSVEASDKNKYKTYASQVGAAYKMYNGTADYGGDVLGGCLDIRVALIAGEGISLSAESDAVQTYLDKFAEKNKLQGSRLTRMIEIGELEGKALLRLAPEGKKGSDDAYIKLSAVSWQATKYSVKVNDSDPEKVAELKIGEKKLPLDSSVYVRIGGSPADVEDTTNRIHRILTDFEYMSRAKYDLNKNTRLFGKVIPTWKTVDMKEARGIKRDIEAADFDIGNGFVGPAQMALLEPTGAAAEAIEKLFLLYMKIVSTATGIPIHWLAFPELMSNRATAENLTEVINAATKKERMIWEEKIKEAIEISRRMAVDAGFEKNAILAGDFTVTLPFVSIEMLKSIVDVYLPLEEAGLFSRKTLRDICPLGLNWREEDRQIALEKKRAAKNSPLANQTTQDALAAARAAQGQPPAGTTPPPPAGAPPANNNPALDGNSNEGVD
jgi:hypothetical protein